MRSMPIRTAIAIVCCCVFLTACEIERAQEATDAQKSMVGLTKEQVLACMGTPASSAQVGDTEVWTYNSGNGRTDTFGSVFLPSQPVIGGFVSATSGTMSATSTSRFCKVDIVMADDTVSRINYSGPTGGLLTRGEQCAFAVDNCARELKAAATAPQMSTAPHRAPFGATFETGDGASDDLAVARVTPGEVADHAGIRPGDILLSFDGHNLDSPAALQTALHGTRAGETKEIQLLRDGEKVSVEAGF